MDILYLHININLVPRLYSDYRCRFGQVIYRSVMINHIVYRSQELTKINYNGVIMGAMASQITSLPIVYSTVYSVEDQRKHQSPASLAFVRGIHWRPVNSPHKGPVTRKMSPFDDTSMALFMYGMICWLVNIHLPQVGGIILTMSFLKSEESNMTRKVVKLNRFTRKLYYPFINC